MLPPISLKIACNKSEKFLAVFIFCKERQKKPQRFLRYLSYPGKTFKKGFKSGLFVFFCSYSINIKENTRDYC